jgi:hypothetical protein
LAAIAAPSLKQIWVTGTDLGAYALGRDGSGSFLDHRQRSRWQSEKLPNRQLLNALASAPSGTLWAVGLNGSGYDENRGFPAETTPLIERHGC